MQRKRKLAAHIKAAHAVKEIKHCMYHHFGEKVPKRMALENKVVEKSP